MLSIVRPLAAAIAALFNGGAVVLLPALGAAVCLTGLPEAVAQVDASCAGSPSAECTDVPVDGIRYTVGVDTVNVRDGVAGTTVVRPGRSESSFREAA